MFFIINDCTQHHVIHIHVDASAHTVGDTIRLLENLLKHKVGISAFLYLSEIEVNGLYLRIDLAIIYIHHLKLFSTSYHGDITVFKIHHLVGVFYQRTGVGANEELVLAYTYNQWRLLARSDNLVGVVAVEQGNGVCTNHFMQSQLHCSKKVDVLLFAYILYQLHQHLGVGIADELNALGYKLCLEVGIVLYYTIMNNGEILRHGIVGMGIERRWFSVSGPTGMCYTYIATNVFVFTIINQIIHLAFRLINIKTTVFIY